MEKPLVDTYGIISSDSKKFEISLDVPYAAVMLKATKHDFSFATYPPYTHIKFNLSKLLSE